MKRKYIAIAWTPIARTHKNDTFSKIRLYAAISPLPGPFLRRKEEKMGWRIVEIHTDENIRLYLNNLMIKRENEKILIRISDIDTLILNNSRMVVSIRLLNALSNSNVNVIVMSNIYEPNSYLIPINGNHNSLKVLERQIKWTHPYKGLVWQNIVKNKIDNQCKHLLEQKIEGVDENWFKDLIDNTKSYDVTNREGHAAKVYWNMLFGIKFIRDQKSFKYPIINSMLNYGYAILRSLVIKSIIKKGLDPRISLFHKSFSNFFALASDLMEAYRPLVDEIVYKFKDEKMFSFEVKNELVGLLEKQVFLNNKKEFINNAIDKHVDALISGNGWIWLKLWD